MHIAKRSAIAFLLFALISVAISVFVCEVHATARGRHNMLNQYFEDDRENSYEWGAQIADVIEIALAAFETIAPNAGLYAKCAIADAIIEGADKPGISVDWAAAYQGARDYSPRLRIAMRNQS